MGNVRSCRRATSLLTIVFVCVVSVGCADEVTLGGASLTSRQQRVLTAAVGSGVEPTLSSYHSPTLRRAVDSARLSGSGSGTDGVFFVFDGLDPDTTYKVRISGQALEAETRFRLRTRSDERRFYRAPTNGSIDFPITERGGALEILIFSDGEFAYSLRSVSVERCDTCADRAAQVLRRTAVYVLQLILISTALGLASLALPRVCPVPPLSRFLIGFALTPYALGIWMMSVAYVRPGASRWYFIAGPILLALVAIGLWGPGAVRRIAEALRQRRHESGSRLVRYMPHLGAAAVLLMLSGFLVANGRAPVIEADALVYLGEALHFAREPQPSNIVGILGDDEGTFKSAYHGFVFQAYLSHALMSLTPGPIDYPGSTMVGAPFQMTFVYMLLAVSAAAATIRTRGTVALTILLTLLASPLVFISYGLDRDGFRIIPLMLLVTLLSQLSDQRKAPGLFLLSISMLSAAAMTGHALGGPVAVIILAAWAGARLLRGENQGKLILAVGFAGALGLLLGGGRHLEAYWETGRLLGYANGAVLLEGSVADDDPLSLEEAYARMNRTPVLTRIKRFMTIDHWILSLMGSVIATGLLVCWPWFRRTNHAFPLLFSGLLTVLVVAPLLGAFDWLRDFPLSESLIRNPRYFLHYYPIAALNIALVSVAVCERLSKGRSAGTSVFSAAAVARPLLYGCFALVVACGSTWTLSTRWRRAELWHEIWFDENIAPLQSVAEQLPPDRRFLIEDQRYRYYLPARVMTLHTLPAWGVIQARDQASAKQEMDARDIAAVAVHRKFRSAWKRLPFGQALIESADQPAWAQTPEAYVFLRTASGSQRLPE